jgi:hypothetical protein
MTEWPHFKIRRDDHHYPIVLPVRYQARRSTTLYAFGQGQTVSIGSKSIIFIAEQPLVAGLTADLTVDWPALLDDSVRLQVHIRGKIDQADEHRTFLQIMGHEFRTRAASSPSKTAIDPRNTHTVVTRSV